MMETKRCRKCKQEKSVDAFGIDSRHVDGLNLYCKACLKPDYTWWHKRQMMWENGDYRIARQINTEAYEKKRELKRKKIFGK